MRIVAGTLPAVAIATAQPLAQDSVRSPSLEPRFEVRLDQGASRRNW
jgi:hypothetical protein